MLSVFHYGRTAAWCSFTAQEDVIQFSRRDSCKSHVSLLFVIIYTTPLGTRLLFSLYFYVTDRGAEKLMHRKQNRLWFTAFSYKIKIA
jgi:hypothetical protein